MQVNSINDAGPSFGNVSLGGGQRMQVEFVSANPTGPLTIGSARNAAIGDTLVRILRAAGYDVATEYYVNDAGSQVRHFGESIYARYAQQWDAKRYSPRMDTKANMLRKSREMLLHAKGKSIC